MISADAFGRPKVGRTMKLSGAASPRPATEGSVLERFVRSLHLLFQFDLCVLSHSAHAKLG